MKTKIHFNDSPYNREMTVYLPDENKTYFLPVDRFDEILRIMKFTRIDEIEKEIRLFLEK